MNPFLIPSHHHYHHHYHHCHHHHHHISSRTGNIITSSSSSSFLVCTTEVPSAIKWSGLERKFPTFPWLLTTQMQSRQIALFPISRIAIWQTVLPCHYPPAPPLLENPVPELPLSRQCAIPWQFHDISLTVCGTPAHVNSYSYHASNSVIVSGGGRNATLHDPKPKWNAQAHQS